MNGLPELFAEVSKACDELNEANKKLREAVEQCGEIMQRLTDNYGLETGRDEASK